MRPGASLYFPFKEKQLALRRPRLSASLEGGGGRLGFALCCIYIRSRKVLSKTGLTCRINYGYAKSRRKVRGKRQL
jgi:hypothetical protein